MLTKAGAEPRGGVKFSTRVVHGKWEHATASPKSEVESRGSAADWTPEEDGCVFEELIVFLIKSPNPLHGFPTWPPLSEVLSSFHNVVWDRIHGKEEALRSKGPKHPRTQPRSPPLTGEPVVSGVRLALGLRGAAWFSGKGGGTGSLQGTTGPLF